WVVFNTSWPVVSSFLLKTAWAITWVTLAPIIWQPNHSPYFPSEITCTKRSFSLEALAFALALRRNFPTFNSSPVSFAFLYVIPTLAISGDAYVQPGIFP